MVFSREAPRAVEVMTPPPAVAAAAAAAPSSSPSRPPPHREAPALLRAGKPRSRIPVPALNAWSNQRLARCVDTAAGNGAQAPTASSPAPFMPASSSRHGSSGCREDGFERIRAKLMDHLREAAERIDLPRGMYTAAPGEESRRKANTAAVAPVKPPDDGRGPDAATATVNTVTTVTTAPAPPPATTEERPWNLRTRRSTPASSARPPHPSLDASTVTTTPRATPRLRSGAPERRESALRRRRVRFSVPLTKEEIDEDMYAFTGRLATRRPKKRPRAVQRQLDLLFPGLYLSEVTPDMYQVADAPPPPPS